MPRRLTYKEVKNYIENHNCKLLEDEYINSSTKMRIQCSCGTIFFRDFAHFKRGQNLCSKCRKELNSKRKRLNYKEVKNYIEEHGCTLLSQDYKNYITKLEIKCSCGKIFYKDLSHFKAGQDKCPECGKKENTKKRIKYTLEVAKELLKERNYKMINEEEYIDGYHPIKCKCSKGHIFDIKIGYLAAGYAGCKECANINLRGKNHWNYKGGESEIIDLARKSVKEWRDEILKRDNYCCVFTSEKDCVVHHIESFSNIVQEASKITNIPILPKVKDYKNREEVDILINKIKDLHTLDKGVTISKELHKIFHKKYGYGYNTRSQYEEFTKEILKPVR